MAFAYIIAAIGIIGSLVGILSFIKGEIVCNHKKMNLVLGILTVICITSYIIHCYYYENKISAMVPAQSSVFNNDSSIEGVNIELDSINFNCLFTEDVAQALYENNFENYVNSEGAYIGLEAEVKTYNHTSNPMLISHVSFGFRDNEIQYDGFPVDNQKEKAINVLIPANSFCDSPMYVNFKQAGNSNLLKYVNSYLSDSISKVNWNKTKLYVEGYLHNEDINNLFKQAVYEYYSLTETPKPKIYVRIEFSNELIQTKYFDFLTSD